MNPRSFVLRQSLQDVARDAVERAGAVAGLGAAAAAWGLRKTGRHAEALRLLMRAHAAALSDRTDPMLLGPLIDDIARAKTGGSTPFRDLTTSAVDAAIEAFARTKADPRRLVGTRILVIKRARPGERGVVVVDYNYMFPLFAGLFDLQAVLERYFLVLEPGWIGYCTPDILLYASAPGPIFVETVEPRDQRFLATVGDPFRPVFGVTGNYWVDYRQMSPRPAAERDIDVISIAAWARYKRHWRLFRALADLKRRGRRLRTALVGYPVDLRRSDIEALAKHYGVFDQLEFHERIPPAEVGALLSRSKVHVLWSRREGSPRAIVEAMFADVPTILREGFNFGHHYVHINEQTGRFVQEGELADGIASVLDNLPRYSPRSWALQHMTCQRATEALERVIEEEARRLGEPWTEGLAVRLSTLDAQGYWDPADRDRFEADHDFLRRACRAPTAGV